MLFYVFQLLDILIDFSSDLVFYAIKQLAACGLKKEFVFF